MITPEFDSLKFLTNRILTLSKSIQSQSAASSAFRDRKKPNLYSRQTRLVNYSGERIYWRKSEFHASQMPPRMTSGWSTKLHAFNFEATRIPYAPQPVNLFLRTESGEISRVVLSAESWPAGFTSEPSGLTLNIGIAATKRNSCVILKRKGAGRDASMCGSTLQNSRPVRFMDAWDIRA